MGVARLIRRTAPLIAVGLAGAAVARRRAARVRQAQLPPPPYPPPVATAEPVIEAEPEEAVEPEPETTEMAPWLDSDDAEDERPAPEEPEPETVEASTVTEIVDDLLTPGDSAERIEDVTIVEGGDEDQAAPREHR